MTLKLRCDQFRKAKTKLWSSTGCKMDVKDFQKVFLRFSDGELSFIIKYDIRRDTCQGVFLLMSSMAWVKRCYCEKLKNLNKLLVFEALYP